MYQVDLISINKLVVQGFLGLDESLLLGFIWSMNAPIKPKPKSRH